VTCTRPAVGGTETNGFAAAASTENDAFNAAFATATQRGFAGSQCRRSVAANPFEREARRY
jgi:hypothetical protein